MKTNKFVFIVILFLITLNISACFPTKDLNFSYEELSEGLLRIEYWEFTVLDEDQNICDWEFGVLDEYQYTYDKKTLLIFDKEDTEYILQNISNITFEAFYAGPLGLVGGHTIVLVYDEYHLEIRDRRIVYHWFDGKPRGQAVYTTTPNEELQKLINYIDLNILNKYLKY